MRSPRLAPLTLAVLLAAGCREIADLEDAGDFFRLESVNGRTVPAQYQRGDGRTAYAACGTMQLLDGARFALAYERTYVAGTAAPEIVLLQGTYARPSDTTMTLHVAQPAAEVLTATRSGARLAVTVEGAPFVFLRP
ncbi:hypothetical protein [Roseisolibacter sp. H3M3-2]|uniref:hypothetical protein n=1 Tax=Roseisolibacter sp. H3M3-2 TaxID=3031323 RepID=UPI0023D9D51E|nr:hypothetical protein [Roseisolibacter sp. H3M3-2]MDF1505212.1 hypothetical protein [Roseisolibacter sp. H3M3-2]